MPTRAQGYTLNGSAVRPIAAFTNELERAERRRQRMIAAFGAGLSWLRHGAAAGLR